MAKKYNITAITYNKRGRILSVGKNSYTKTHPLMLKFGDNPECVYLHAEIDALIKARSQVHKMVIIRYDQHGAPASAMPCKICQNAINYYKVKIVEHT